ncbi:MAG TPA: hypothetical protein VJ810_31045 [Blastocatellia bacterium]|nr:hypothetical protein [Blastocatellia bacterium]
MIFRKYVWLASLVMLFLSMIPSAMCVDAAGQFKQENRPENLKALLESIHNLIHVKKDARSAATLLVSLYPNEERAKRALRDGIPPETLQKILEMHKRFGSLAETSINELAGTDQKVVKVYGATTEEIARNQRDSVVFAEFPGGAIRMAKEILRQGMTFYEAEFLEPGKENGVKYHLFYWDGKQWTMLGPVWRSLQ